MKACKPTIEMDAERLEALAEWFCNAALWLQQEVDASRADHEAHQANDLVPDEMELVAFRCDQLDSMLTGLRRASHMLLAMGRPMPSPLPMNTGTVRRGPSSSHLHVVK